jgi:RNA polymerase sigma-70 factor (ECF subfamily)
MVDDFDAWYLGLRPVLIPALTGWCGDASLASDALDEAFVRAVERWDRIGGLDERTGWVWRTATNVVRRRMRRRDLERRLLRRHVAGSPSDGREPTYEDVDLRRSLLELTARQRTAVVLHYLADLPLREVAQLMGVAEGTVSATLHQSRAQLARMLAPEEDGEFAPEPSSQRPLENRHD